MEIPLSGTRLICVVYEHDTMIAEIFITCGKRLYKQSNFEVG